MAQDGQIPDWLTGLRDQQQGEQPDDLPAFSQQPPIQPVQPESAEGAQPRRGRADVMEDLREQMIQAEEAYEHAERRSLVQFFLNLQPWQRLILAVLLFFDVALCGCMGLVMAGRVMLPF